jgi:hypothetical protein
MQNTEELDQYIVFLETESAQLQEQYQKSLNNK